MYDGHVGRRFLGTDSRLPLWSRDVRRAVELALEEGPATCEEDLTPDEPTQLLMEAVWLALEEQEDPTPGEPTPHPKDRKQRRGGRRAKNAISARRAKHSA